jgi:hypothetical protein
MVGLTLEVGMRHLRALVMSGALLVFLQITAVEDFYTLEGGPYHEGFVDNAINTIVLQAIAQEPPTPLDEQKPAACGEGAEWLPGYWVWSAESDAFVWVSGVWRFPPPGHQWVLGAWKKVDVGWVWIRGFWIKSPHREALYIDKVPPQPLQEAAEDPSEGKMFWMPGYWMWAKGDKEFRWHGGQWAKVDSDWVYTPAHWEWQPDGFLFIPAYWDHPLEERGCAYPAVKGDGQGAKQTTTPTQPASTDDILSVMLLYYPDYSCFFQQHYLTHQNYWSRQTMMPPWWRWPVWWTYTWWNQWAVYWWWTHPGYPQPPWITITVSTRIWPPPASFARHFKEIAPPFVITSEGVVTPDQVIGALGRFADKKNLQIVPIIPADAAQQQQLEQAVEPRQREGVRALRPSGRPPGADDKSEGKAPKPEIPIQSPRGGAKARVPSVPAKPSETKKKPLSQPKTQIQQPVQGEEATSESQTDQSITPDTNQHNGKKSDKMGADDPGMKEARRQLKAPASSSQQQSSQPPSSQTSRTSVPKSRAQRQVMRQQGGGARPVRQRSEQLQQRRTGSRFNRAPGYGRQARQLRRAASPKLEEEQVPARAAPIAMTQSDEVEQIAGRE